jgi:hypothetical protein
VFIGAGAYLFSGGQLKSILMITALLVSFIAFGQEKHPPEPKAEGQSADQTQPSRPSQGGAITNLSDVIENRIGLAVANRAGLPVDWTKRALKDEEGLCKVHHEKLTRATVPLLYGLLPGPLYSKETEEGLFPNALTSVEAGCIVMAVKEAIVLQCQKCIEAKTKWVESARLQCDCLACLLNLIHTDCPKILKR